MEEKKVEISQNSICRSKEVASHFLVNHSLSVIYFITDSCQEFIDFIHKQYKSAEYEYEIKPVIHRAPNPPYITEKGWKEFCDHFDKEYGRCISYQMYKKNPDIYHNQFASYIESYLTFYEQRQITKRVFSPDTLKKGSILNKGKNTEELKVPVPVPVIETRGYDNEEPYFINNEWKDTQDMIKTVIVYDEGQSVTIVIQDSDCKWVPKWIALIEGMIVLKEYSELYRITSAQLYDYFNFRPFIDSEDVSERVNQYDLLHHISKKRCEVELQIRSHLIRNYTISTDGKKLIKSSILQERIETALLDSTIGNSPIIESMIADTLKFRKLISSVLLEMGLQKKRLSDGIYYYGIEPTIDRERDMTSALETLIKDRECHKENAIKSMNTPLPQ